LLDLPALLLDLLLLRLHLLLGLRVGVLGVLHLISDRVAGYAAEARADRRARAWVSDCGSDNSAAYRADPGATQGALLTS